MKAYTHIAISIAGVGGIYAAFGLTLDSWAVGLAALGSQIPDVDNTKSWIGRCLFPVAVVLERYFVHRTVTHSLLATLAIGGVFWGIGQHYGWSLNYWLAAPIGHLFAILADCFTPEGVRLLYPAPQWFVCGSNPNARIRTGSAKEITVLFLATALSVLFIWVQDSGGFRLALNQALGVRDGVSDLIQAQGSNNHIYVDVVGSFTSDRSPVNKRFWVVDKIGEEFVIADSSGIYQTGQQIEYSRLVPQPGESAKVQAIALNFAEESISQKLEEFATAHPGSLIFISGTVTVEDPEEVRLNPDPKQLPIVIITGNQLTFNYAPVSLAATVSSLQFGSGSLNARVVFPPPKL